MVFCIQTCSYGNSLGLPCFVADLVILTTRVVLAQLCMIAVLFVSGHAISSHGMPCVCNAPDLTSDRAKVHYLMLCFQRNIMNTLYRYAGMG